MTTLPDDMEEAVEELTEEKVAGVTANVRGENKALREENEDLRAQVEELEERVYELEGEDLDQHLNALGGGLSEAHDSTAETEDDVAGLKRSKRVVSRLRPTNYPASIHALFFSGETRWSP